MGWLLLIVYFVLPNRYAMYDPIIFAQAAESGDLRSYPFWHPSHLLYEPVMYGFYRATQEIGLPTTLFQLCTALGILSSFLLVCVVGCLLVIYGVPSRWAALAFSMWAASYVVWHCTTSPEASRNVLAILLLITTFYIIARGRGRSLKVWPFLAGIVIGLAGLFHTLSVFAVPSLYYFLWKHVEKAKRVYTFITVFLVSAVTVFSSYALTIMFLGRIEDIHGFVRWFVAPGGSEWWQSSLLPAGLDFVLTSIRALLGTVTYEPLKRAVLSGGVNHTLTLLFGLLGASLLFYWGFIIISGIVRPSKPLTVIGRAMLLWLICYVPLSVFFDKWDVRVLLYLSVPIAFLIAECSSRRNLRQHEIAAIITILVLFVVNGSTIMHEESKPETQRAYRLLQSMNALSQDPKDLFLVSTATDAQYAQYFGKRKARAVRVADTNFSPLCLDLFDIKKTGKHLFIDTALLDMIVTGKHPSSALLVDLIGLNTHNIGGSEDLGFKLILQTSSR